MSETNTIDTWENRIEQSAKYLGLPKEKVEQILATPGFEITKDQNGLEMLSDENVTPFGDLRKLFCEDNGVAVPKLRMAIKFLRGPSQERKSATETVDPDILELQRRYGVSIKFKLDDLGAEELIPLYNPNKNNRIAEALKKRYGTKAIIAFKPDSDVVAVDETINYIVDLEQGYDEEESIDVDGELVRLYPIGVVPNKMVDEDPLFAGQPLKRNRSTVNRLNWIGVSKEVRQFFRILIDRGEIKADDRLNLGNLMVKRLEDLKNIFPEAYMQYKERMKKDELPKLQISLQEATTASTRKNNPFGVNRSY